MTRLSVLALLFGLCVPLALAPFNFWPLMFVGVAGFFWLSFQARTQKQALWLGWVYGIGYFSLGVSWIYGSMQTVDTPWVLAVLLTGSFCLAMAVFHLFQLWFFHRFLRYLPMALLLLAPIWWLINEWIREWFLTGMPWLFAGYAFTDLAIGQLAAVVGIYGLTLILALCSAWLLKSLLSWHLYRNIRNFRFAAVALSMFTLASVFGALKPAASWTEEVRTLSVAAVQSNVDQRVKWSSAQQRPTLEFYGNSLANMSEADLVLWPEAAMTLRPQQMPSFISQIQSMMKKRDQSLFTGMVTLHDGRYYNALLGYGMASGEYHKQHLVPFGEYVPLEKWLRGLIAFFDLPMSSMYPAAQQQTPLMFSLQEQIHFIAPVICYEAVYPELVRRLAVDAELITVISNDAWFGDSLGPHQHLQMTRLRAIENGRDLLRATQNGISALINANGEILQQSEQFVAEELTGNLTLRNGKTPFQNLPAATIPVLGVVFLLFWLFLDQIKHRSKKRNSP